MNMTQLLLPRKTPLHYDPNPLLDALIQRLNLKDDAALCRLLDVARPVLVRIRARSQAIGAWLLQRMAEISDLSIAELRCLMGDQRVRLRVATGMRRKVGGDGGA